MISSVDADFPLRGPGELRDYLICGGAIEPLCRYLRLLEARLRPPGPLDFGNPARDRADVLLEHLCHQSTRAMERQFVDTVRLYRAEEARFSRAADELAAHIVNLAKQVSAAAALLVDGNRRSDLEILLMGLDTNGFRMMGTARPFSAQCRDRVEKIESALMDSHPAGCEAEAAIFREQVAAIDADIDTLRDVWGGNRITGYFHRPVQLFVRTGHRKEFREALKEVVQQRAEHRIEKVWDRVDQIRSRIDQLHWQLVQGIALPAGLEQALEGVSSLLRNEAPRLRAGERRATNGMAMLD